MVASPQLAMSPVLRGHRAAISRREALILQAIVNHPWLLHDHLEDLAGLEFRHSETEKLKSALLDMFAHEAAPDPDGCGPHWKRRPRRPGRAGRQGHHHRSVWGAREDAAPTTF